MNDVSSGQSRWIGEYPADHARRKWQEERKLFRRTARVWELLPLLGTRAVAPILLFAMPWTELMLGVLALSLLWYPFAVRFMPFESAICISLLGNSLVTVPANLLCALALLWTGNDGAFVAAAWTGITYVIEPVWPRGNTFIIERSLRRSWRRQCESLDRDAAAALQLRTEK